MRTLVEGEDSYEGLHCFRKCPWCSPFRYHSNTVGALINGEIEDIAPHGRFSHDRRGGLFKLKEKPQSIVHSLATLHGFYIKDILCARISKYK